MNQLIKIFVGQFLRLSIGYSECAILMFHRVLNGDTDRTIDDAIWIKKEEFEKTILFLKNHFEFISLNELIEGRKKEKRTCIITFDDGWLDTYQIAFPVLLLHNVPATVFIPTGMVGTNKIFWFERVSRVINQLSENDDGISNVKKHMGKIVDTKIIEKSNSRQELYHSFVQELKKFSPYIIEEIVDTFEQKFVAADNDRQETRVLMNWDEIKGMSDSSISFGSHCVNHSILINLTYKEKLFEIVASRKTLIERKINFVDCISFPNGIYDQEVLDISRKAGYKLLLTASINKCGEGESPLLAHRIGINNSVSSDTGLLAYSIIKAKLKGKLYNI